MEWAEVDLLTLNSTSSKKVVDRFVRRVMERQHLEVKAMDIYMEMLLHINEDFDDDLLQETIELLVD
jgi:hypothetical protein